MNVIITCQVLICQEADGKSCYNEEQVLSSKSCHNKEQVIRDNKTEAGVQ